MKILKFKKTGLGKYNLTLDNGKTLNLYEDVIIKNNLLLTKEIEEKKLDSLIEENNNANVYDKAINYLSTRMRSIKEMESYLLKNGVKKEVAKKTLNRLKKDGYLDDNRFAKAFVKDKFLMTTKGPNKIKKELNDYVNSDISNEAINILDEIEIKEKLEKLLKKQIKIKKGSINSVKIKLLNYFINLGYDKEMILGLIEEESISSDYKLLEKDYNRLYSKYKAKYSGSELLYFISQKLYQKGYTSEDIKSVLKKNQD